jgi:predicted DNA-binding transcriptional regulator AlpA
MEYDYARHMAREFPQQDLKIIRKKELAQKLGVSGRTIQRMVKQKRLPTPLYSPCGHITGWLASDIEQWRRR